MQENDAWSKIKIKNDLCSKDVWIITFLIMFLLIYLHCRLAGAPAGGSNCRVWVLWHILSITHKWCEPNVKTSYILFISWKSHLFHKNGLHLSTSVSVWICARSYSHSTACNDRMNVHGDTQGSYSHWTQRPISERIVYELICRHPIWCRRHSKAWNDCPWGTYSTKAELQRPSAPLLSSHFLPNTTSNRKSYKNSTRTEKYVG